jgi:hypothetical protein
VQRWRSPTLFGGGNLAACVWVMAFAWFGLGVVAPAAAGGMRAQGFCGAPRCQKAKFVRGVTTDRAGTTTARPWHFRRRLSVRTVEISVGWTACGRRPDSKIEKHVIEHPGRAVITTLVRVPALPPGTACLRLRQRRNIRVRLRTPVSQHKLYDGSYSPPKLRWPRNPLLETSPGILDAPGMGALRLKRGE